MPEPSGGPCASGVFPFFFYNEDGENVDGVETTDGLCVFPEANCGLSSVIDECCAARKEFTKTGGNYMFICFAIMLIPIIWLKYPVGVKKMSDEERRKAEKMGEEFAKLDEVESWVPRGFAWVYNLGMTAGITVMVVVPIFMKSSIQGSLDAASRNAQAGAEAFLVPFEQMFDFVQDIVLVRISYAIHTQNKPLTNKLLHLGIVGSLAMGMLAAILGTILGIIPQTLTAMTNPGWKNDQNLYPGCDLISTGEEQRGTILPYWLIYVWEFPGTHLGSVLMGFLYGAFFMHMNGWIIAIAWAVKAIIWFGAGSSGNNKLLVLGFAEFAQSWLAPLLTILYLISPLGKDVRERTGVKLQASELINCLRPTPSDRPQGSQIWTSFRLTPSDMHTADMNATDPENNQSDDHFLSEETRKIPGDSQSPEAAEIASKKEKDEILPRKREIIKDGLKVMVMDVAIQVAMSLGIYLALATDAADAYKIFAMESEVPSYGIAYSFGMSMIMKILGSAFLAYGNTTLFAIFSRVSVLAAFLLVPVIVGSVVPFISGLATATGANSCQYAKDENCVGFFTHVLGPNAAGGDYTLHMSLYTFIAATSVHAIFIVLKSTLYAANDIDYMFWTTLVAMVFYVPTIVIAAMVEPFAGHATAIYAAMYFPKAILCIFFIIRNEMNVRKMQRGEKGPWTDAIVG